MDGRERKVTKREKISTREQLCHNST